MLTATGHAADDVCRSEGASAPHLQLQTTLGTIEIELFADAAPGAVAQLVALAAAGEPEGGYYDGLTFDYTHPRVEIRTAERLPADVAIDTQIDARALRLHEQGPRDAGEAMAIVQEELLGAFRKNKRNDSLTPQLQQWLKAWYASYEPKFLVGVSRREINEALGYSYTEGLASRAVTKGSVALVPRSPAVASPRLSVALRDLPRRTGQWMVVGRVVRGLDLANRISIAPLVSPRSVRPVGYEPRDPVVIESVLPLCGSDSSAKPLQEGTEQ